MSPRLLRWIMNAWPPFLFSGVRVESISADWRHVRAADGPSLVQPQLCRYPFWWQSVFDDDPFWMIMVLRALGDDYIVWDKAGEISFVAPGSRDRALRVSVE